jgi:hypothetical protein
MTHAEYANLAHRVEQESMKARTHWTDAPRAVLLVLADGSWQIDEDDVACACAPGDPKRVVMKAMLTEATWPKNDPYGTALVAALLGETR